MDIFTKFNTLMKLSNHRLEQLNKKDYHNNKFIFKLFYL